MKDQIFDLNIQTVGVVEWYKRQHPDGFDPEDANLYDPHLGNRDLVLKASDGTKFISTKVLNYLLGNSPRPWQATLGRVRLFKWTADLSNDALEHAAYPNRNDRETWVAERNFNIIAWIEAL